MTLQDWAAIGEIVGGAAVVLTLLYLSIQLRQATRQMQASTMQTHSEFNGLAFQQLISNPEFAAIYVDGTRGLAALSEKERIRFVLFLNAAMRYFEHMFFLNRQGALPAGFWYGQERAIQEFLAPPGNQEAWGLNQSMFSREFVAFVAALPPRAFAPILHAESREGAFPARE